mmetsp:Transcript_124663/g.216115  ORF Transcript_124663/g.216115 Transcript_124663/m.216115 type:complete len:213 (+) Transcript_124663:1654-2292(+)
MPGRLNIFMNPFSFPVPDGENISMTLPSPNAVISVFCASMDTAQSALGHEQEASMLLSSDFNTKNLVARVKGAGAGMGSSCSDEDCFVCSFSALATSSSLWFPLPAFSWLSCLSLDLPSKDLSFFLSFFMSFFSSFTSCFPIFLSSFFPDGLSSFVSSRLPAFLLSFSRFSFLSSFLSSLLSPLLPFPSFLSGLPALQSIVLCELNISWQNL